MILSCGLRLVHSAAFKVARLQGNRSTKLLRYEHQFFRTHKVFFFELTKFEKNKERVQSFGIERHCFRFFAPFRLLLASERSHAGLDGAATHRVAL